MLVSDGFDAAVLGVACRCGDLPTVIYDLEKVSLDPGQSDGITYLPPVFLGEERIANELLLKLGLRVSLRTVRKYLPKRPPGRPRGDQRWATFLRNHAGANRRL